MRQNGVRSNVRFPYSKGKSAKRKKFSQGYAAREDESLGMRTGKESTKKQSMKDRRDESYGAWGKRTAGKVNIQEFIMGWKSKVAKKVWGAIKGKGKVYKTIKSVKPLSGKTPWYVGASPNTAASRARIVKTHLGLERSQKIEDAEKGITKGKKTLKHMEDTGQAQKVGEKYFRKGFK